MKQVVDTPSGGGSREQNSKLERKDEDSFRRFLYKLEIPYTCQKVERTRSVASHITAESVFLSNITNLS